MRAASAASSPAARTGAFIAVAVALGLFCVHLLALDPAVPTIAEEADATAPPAARWTPSAYILAIGFFFSVGGRPGDVLGQHPGTVPAAAAAGPLPRVDGGRTGEGRQ
ncbi:hypothetical protein [Streptomyces formicae]|uniref:MFS transporter n=1 Tax=Streptomyces formicae TaxID=1616117 RepID=A0ABY3WMR1_9ACTN|nr:hypothetical protein [Streptomyces formicae]UNM12072.1 hypothetical protein J4032_11460 [Streptomyces formicae]